MTTLPENSPDFNPAISDARQLPLIAGQDYTCKHLPCSYPLCQETSWEESGRRAYGQYLTCLRVAAGLSRAALSRATGIADHRLKSWETGWGYPGKFNCIKLSEAFGVELAELSRIEFASVPYHCFCLASEGGESNE